jgi:hypothetical protein
VSLKHNKADDQETVENTEDISQSYEYVKCKSKMSTRIYIERMQKHELLVENTQHEKKLRHCNINTLNTLIT